MPTGPAKLIKNSGKRPVDLAAEAKVASTTIYLCLRFNAWPQQERPRCALARVLGVPGDPLAVTAVDSDQVGHASDSTDRGVA